MSTATEQTKIYPGIKEYDNCINYFRPGLHIIASKFGAGKTDLMLSMLRQICTVQKQAAAFFTNDHSHMAISNRITELEIGYRILLSTYLFDPTMAFLFEEIYDKYKDPENNNKSLLHFGDAIDYDRMKEKITYMIANHSVKIIFIENLNRINWYSKLKNDQSPCSLINEVIFDLHKLSIELNIPIVIATHLNRNALVNEPPTLSDLRYTGTIEEIASTITLIQKNEGERKAKLIVAKHRWRPEDAPKECIVKINDKTGEFY